MGNPGKHRQEYLTLSNKINNKRVDECNTALTEKLSRFFPFKESNPSAAVKINIGTATIDGEEWVKWGVTCTQRSDEFVEYLFGEGSAEDNKNDVVVQIGRERLMSPCFVLYSSFMQKMLCCTFDSKSEAMLYAKYAGIGGFLPVESKSKFASDPWYECDNHKKASQFGYREIALPVGGADTQSLIRPS